MSPWTPWSKPDATGTIYRVRYVIRPALNGGKECEDLMQLKKGMEYGNIEEMSNVMLLMNFLLVK